MQVLKFAFLLLSVTTLLVPAALATSFYDFIVIGTGTAGSVATGLLSANPTVSVLALDAGEDYSEEYWTSHNLGPFYNSPFAKHLKPPTWRHGFSVGALFDRDIHYPVPEMFGGSSSTNGAVWGRFSREQMDRWAAEGLTGWGFDDFDPLYKSIENWQSADPNNLHGHDGPVVTQQFPPDDSLNRIMDSMVNVLNLSRVDDFNVGTLRGVGVIPRNIQPVAPGVSIRQDAFTTFVKPHLATRSNLKVLGRSRVLRIHPTTSNVLPVKVEYIRDGKIHTAYAMKEVVLSAGALMSPFILMHSGIGDCNHLAQHNIQCVKHLPGVGTGLKDHSFVFVFYNGPEQNESSYGVMVAAFTKSKESMPDLDAEISVVPIPLFPGTSLYAAAVNHLLYRANGTIRLFNNDPFKLPLITLPLLQDPEDLEAVRWQFEKIREIFAPLDGFVETADQAGIPPDASEFDKTFWLANHIEHTAHYTSSTRVGLPTDPMAVVDLEMRLYGFPRIRIADNGVWPSQPACHCTNSGAFTIGAKVAKLIKAKYNI